MDFTGINSRQSATKTDLLSAAVVRIFTKLLHSERCLTDQVTVAFPFVLSKVSGDPSGSGKAKNVRMRTNITGIPFMAIL